MTHTENYELSQWQKSDRLMMSDFNADNAKLDAALATLARSAAHVVTGTYTGDGEASRTIDLGFQPSFVFVCNLQGLPRDSSAAWGGVALPNLPVTYSYSTVTAPVLTVVENGFTVYYRSFAGANYIGSNAIGSKFIYLAIK